jgi:hypothetical protein
MYEMKKIPGHCFKKLSAGLLILFLISGCSVSRKPQKLKNCDCPQWSNAKTGYVNDDCGRI